MMNAGQGPDGDVSLPAERTFVVQFRTGTAVGRDGPWNGRVEHVVSGRAARFEDCATLREFVIEVLAEGGPGRRAGGPVKDGDHP